MDCFRYNGITLASAIPLPELEPAPAGLCPDLTVALASSVLDAPFPSEPVQWLQEWNRADDCPYFSIGCVPQGYLLRFWDYADFLYAPASAQLFALPQSGLPDTTLRHLLLDQVLPSVLCRFGRLALHASGITHEGGAVAFLGDSGFGKSSLAAYFAQCGAPLISDDCLVLHSSPSSGVLASLAYPGVRLVPEAIRTLVATPGPLLEVAHYSNKHRLSGDRVGLLAREPSPLRFLFVLGDPAAPISHIGVTPVIHREAFIALRRGTFSLDMRNAAETAAQFQLLAAAASQVQAFALQYPRSWSWLAQVRQAVLTAISSQH